MRRLAIAALLGFFLATPQAQSKPLLQVSANTKTMLVVDLGSLVTLKNGHKRLWQYLLFADPQPIDTDHGERQVRVMGALTEYICMGHLHEKSHTVILTAPES